MTKKAKGRIRIIACVFLLAGIGVFGANQARAAITPAGQVLPAYDASDPWIIEGNLYVGNDENGALTVDGGSSVSDVDGVIAYYAGVTGSVTITGPDSSWVNSEWLVVGYEGFGTLTINSGGQVSSYDGVLGNEAGSTGAATVTGAGSTWTIDEHLEVGYEGTGLLTIEDGGLVEVSNLYIGDAAGAIGGVFVRDPNSHLNVSESIFLGYDGQAELQVTNGGQVSSFYGALGYDLGSYGSATVSGSGSLWDNTGSFGVGVFGDGDLLISDGGTVNSVESGVGLAPAVTGTVTVTGAGSAWNHTEELAIGGWGTGYLDVLNGGQVTSGDAYIGGFDVGVVNVSDPSLFSDDPTGTGDVVVTGSDSRWDVLGTLYVGYTGTGTLEVRDTGVVTSESGMLGFSADSVGTATVTGDGSQWDVNDVLTVGGAGEGTLVVSDRGRVTAGDVQLGGYIPEEGFETLADFLDPDAVLPEGTGTVTVITEAVLESDGLSIGFWGNGTLDVNEGGQVVSGWAELGVGPNAVGTATVRGATSTWTIDDELTVGVYGQGDLTIAAGAQVSAYDVYVGGAPLELMTDEGYDPDLLPNGTGTVTVTGVDSHLTVAGEDSLYVGYFGNGTLDVNDGGQVDSATVVVGAGPDAVGTVRVEDAGSLLSAEELLVGFWGQGDVTVAAGGQITAGEVTIGGGEMPDDMDPDMLADFGDLLGTGTIIVTGAGSRLDVDDFLYVGYTGTGTLDVNDGGIVTSAYGAVGADPGSTGTVAVTDNGSEWQVTEALVVGAFGQGDLMISSGGHVTASDVYIGGFDTDILDEEIEGIPDGIGTVTVTGEDSLLDVWADTTLYVGYTGDGTLDVLDGGYVISQNSYIGYEEGSIGTVNVSDPNSLWTVTQGLRVGYGGDGTLNILDGGAVTSITSHIGYQAGSIGVVNVANGTWANDTDLYVGVAGHGELRIFEGGQVTTDGAAYLGTSEDSFGYVRVSGEDSLWQIGGEARVGNDGEGSLEILNGGRVESGEVTVGHETGSIGEVTVDGEGSQWNASDLSIGRSGTGTLTISDGGTVTADSAIVGQNVDSSGTVLVTGADSLWDMSSSLWVGFRGEGELTIADGGQVRSEHGYIADNEAVSVGTVTVTGEDSLWLVDGNLFVGGNDTQAVGTGVLAVNDGGRVIADEVIVWETGTLTGDGTVTVAVPTTLHNYGTIAPGDDGIGTLTVQGNVVFEPNSVFEVQIGGTEADQLAVTGDVTIDEGSTVRVLSVGTVVGTQQYAIIDANSVTGEFDVLDTALLTLYFNEIGLDYEPNSVWLHIDAMRFDDPTLLRTYNQRQVAGGLQEIADEGGNTITAALQMVETNEELLDNYDQLAGRSRPSLAPIAVAGTSRFLGSVSSRLRNPSAVVASGSWNGSQLSGSAGPDGTAGSRMSYDIDMGGYGFAVGNGSPYLSDSPWGFWAKGYGLFGNRDHSLEAPGYDYRTYGLSVGLDYQFTETLLIGLTGGYADTHVNYDRSRDDSDLRAMHFGFYGSLNTGRGYLDSLLTYSDLDYDTQRYVDLTGERLEGEFGGYAVSGYFETGFDWRHVGGWLVQPLASFQFSYLGLDNYRESGGDAALGFKRQSFESYIGSLGAKVSKELLRDSATSRLAVQFRARWLHEFGDTRSDVNTYFASDPTVVFNIRNESIDRDSAVLGLGLGAELNRSTRLYVDYDTRLNADDTAHLISGGLQYRW